MTSSNCRSSRSGPRLDLAEIEARLDVEIIGAGAVLEIEIDQAGRGLAARAAVEQQHGGLHRERGDAGAADGGQEGENLRFGRVARWAAALATRAQVRTSSTGDTGLTRKSATRICIRRRATAAVEALRDRDDRRPVAEPHHDAFERLQLGLVAGIEVGDDDGGAFERRSGRAPTAGP